MMTSLLPLASALLRSRVAHAVVVFLLLGPVAVAQNVVQNTVEVLRPSGPSGSAERGGGGYPLALGGTGFSRIFETASDDDGNTYVVGDFTGQIDFDPGPGQILGTSMGGNDFFAASYDPAGALRWAFRYGTNQFNQVGNGIAVAGGRVFFGGIFWGTVNFGGDEPADANVIAFNNGPGVIVRSSIVGPVAIRRNAVYGNLGLGIDLEPAGRATNDAGDGGPNQQQNYPVFASATGDGAATLTLTYTVDTAPANAAYPLTVHVYIADASGQGQRWVGSLTYAESQAQSQVMDAFGPFELVSDGDQLVATATDANGNTSEFSDPVAVSGSAVTNEDDADPTVFALAAYPNPVRGVSTLALTLPEAGAVRVEVFDMLGRRVAVLHDGAMAAGLHPLVLDASALPAGLYVSPRYGRERDPHAADHRRPVSRQLFFV